MRRALLACSLLAACGSNVPPPTPKPVQTDAPGLLPPETTTTTTTLAPVTTVAETTTTTEPPAEVESEAVPTTTVRRVTVTTEYDPPSPQGQTTRQGSGECGGDLPPCTVLARESGGDLTIYNTQGSGASGKWQAMPGTWDGYGGYNNAADAPEAVQDAFAAELWNHGLGCAHWQAC